MLFSRLSHAVNNNKSVTGVGGTHWSLLCYECKSQQFYTFDSMGSVRCTIHGHCRCCSCNASIFLISGSRLYALIWLCVVQNNLNESKQLANKLYPLFLHFTKQHAKQPSNKSNAKKTAQKAKASATVNVAICPQQNNSYDCGVYTLGCCEQIATYLLQADTTDTAADDEKSQQRTTSLADTALQTHLKKQLTASNITVLRTRIKQAIQQVQKTYK